MSQFEMDECILCYEASSIFSVGNCNHSQVCYLCIIKMRNKLNNDQCPICKEILKYVILSYKNRFKSFLEYDKKNLIEYLPGIYYEDREVGEELNLLNQYKCWVPNCRDANFNFESIGNLKKHFKNQHQRFLCPVCLESRTQLLTEQKLYTHIQLEKHMEQGDLDEDGNIIFLHPFCQFCNKMHYSEEEFSKHLVSDHFNCHVCGSEYKYRFYKNYQALEKHFNYTHYLCQEPICKQKNFIVFRTPQELELHTVQVHSDMYDSKKGKQQLKQLNQFNLQTMASFHYGDSDQQVQEKKNKIQFKDKEGVSFEDQFLSLRKLVCNTISQHKDESEDMELDFRDFQKPEMLLDERSQEYYLNQQKEFQKQNKGNRTYSFGKDIVQYVAKKQSDDLNGISESNKIYLDDLKVIRYQQLQDISNEQFEKTIDQHLNKNGFNRYYQIKNEYFKNLIDHSEFMNKFIELFGKNIAFRIFPQFLKTIQNTFTQQELDKEYFKQLQHLDRKVTNLFHISITYSQFFRNLNQAIELNLRTRIKENKLNVSKPFKMDQSRLSQLIEILRRIKTPEMVRLKFLTNYGVSVDTLNYLKNELFLMDCLQLQNGLDKISNDEIILIYLYCNMCYSLLVKVKIQKEKMRLANNILEEFFEKNEDLVQKQAENQAEESQVKEIQIPEIVIPKNKSVESKKRKQIIDNHENDNQKERKKSEEEKFDQNCKYEFPDLKNKQNNRNVTIGPNYEIQNQNPFLYKSINPNTNLKQILKDEFPLLEGGSTQQQSNEKNQKNQNNDEQKQEIWQPEFIKNQSNNQVIGVKGKGKKKKQVLSGGFI